MENDYLDRFKKVYFDNPSIAKTRGRITEADTRANVIDRIIHEILGWPRSSIDREPFANPGYIDYQFRHILPIILLEAKAEGEFFELPYHKQPRRRLKISGALSTDKKIHEAIIQVQRYCSDTGTRYAIVTNGYTFIIFRAITEGTLWRDGQAVVFIDYNDIANNFTEFWNLLSYEAVKDGKLDAFFRNCFHKERSYYRPIDEIVDSDATYGRNPFNNSLRPFVDRFFGDIASQDTIDILKNCYVYSRPVQAIDKQLKLFIKDEIPNFACSASQIIVEHECDGGNVGAQIKKTISNRPPKGSVILIMGGIGSGKSTFCKRFFKVVAPEIVGEKGPAILIYLDFLGAPDYPEQLESFLWDKAKQSIRNADSNSSKKQFFEKIFCEQIDTIKEIFGEDPSVDEKINCKIFELIDQPKQFVESSLRHYALRDRLPMVVFDNVDQLRFEAQAQIFTTAHNFANSYGCLSLVVLREESFSTALMKKHLTAYSIRPYHLSSPKFNKLLELRINVAVNDAIKKSKQHGANKDTKQYGEIASLFGLLRQSMLGKNKNIIRLVESIAYGNMRFALNLFNSFITSGATNITKIISIHKTKGDYIVPFHEFIKSVILGDYIHYKEQRSLIQNLFHINREPNASHFTGLRILKYLSDRGIGTGRIEDFVGLQLLLTDITDIFNNEVDCKKNLIRLINIDRQLIELDSRRPDTLDGAKEVRITAAGVYYLNYMVNSFQYLDLVWHDTPFATRGICGELLRTMHERDLSTRFSRVDKFLNYLEKEEKEELSLLPDIPSFCGPFIPIIREFYENEKKTIQKRQGS